MIEVGDLVRYRHVNHELYLVVELDITGDGDVWCKLKGLVDPCEIFWELAFGKLEIL